MEERAGSSFRKVQDRFCSCSYRRLDRIVDGCTCRAKVCVVEWRQSTADKARCVGMTTSGSAAMVAGKQTQKSLIPTQIDFTQIFHVIY